MLKVAIVNIQPFRKGSTRAIFDLQYNNLLVKGLSLHEKDGSRWIKMPMKEKADNKGKTYYQEVASFPDKAKLKAFENWCIKQLTAKMWKPSILDSFPRGVRNQADPTKLPAKKQYQKKHDDSPFGRDSDDDPVPFRWPEDAVPKESQGGLRISPESDRITGLTA